MRCFLLAVDIISAIEFNKTGDHLATGDRGGRVVLFERTDAKDVCSPPPFILGSFSFILSYKASIFSVVELSIILTSNM